MRRPWSSREKRESSFTDALVQQIMSTVTGPSLARPTTIAALECAANLYARGFAAAKVQGPAWAQRVLSPACLAMIGRALIREGEIVLAIDAADGELKLWPVADYDVHGSFDPAGWTYRLNLAGPSFFVTRDPVAAAGVLHLMYARDPQRPWRGVGPLDSASATGALAANLEARLGEEAGGPVTFWRSPKTAALATMRIPHDPQSGYTRGEGPAVARGNNVGGLGRRPRQRARVRLASATVRRQSAGNLARTARL